MFLNAYNVQYPVQTAAQFRSGGIILKKCIAAMPSYTYAVKGEKLLRARGYPCEIKRIERTEGKGCGFSLVIHGRCDEALELLRRSSVPFSDVWRGGG